MKHGSLKSNAMMAATVLAAMLAAVWLAALDRKNDSQAILLPDRVMTVFPVPKPLTAFALTDHQHRVFDVSRLKGKWSFLFFGYTHCPDICPATLAILARARDDIANSAVDPGNIQFVFISVDPNRDTPAKLGEYVAYFHAMLLGVTGDDAQIGNLAGQLDAAYQVEFTPGSENYPVYHSASVFLVDPQARYLAMFKPPLDAETIGRRFKVLQELEAARAK